MHPNSIANLRPAWKPGQIPNPTGVNGQRRIERALAIAQKASPKAARLISDAISDRDLPMGLRLRCAEYVLDKTLPSQKGEKGLLEALSGGIECLELRFVAPGREVSETISLPLSTDTSSLKDKAISTTYSVDEQSSHTLSHTEDGAESSESEDGE